MRMGQQREHLLNTLRNAEQVFKELKQQRATNENKHQAPYLEYAFLKASSDIARAEREYNIFTKEITALVDMPFKTRAEMESEYTSKKARTQNDLKQDDEVKDAFQSEEESRVSLAQAVVELREMQRVFEAREQSLWDELKEHREYKEW